MGDLLKLEALCREQSIHFERDASLAEHCTFKIGGRAALVARPASLEQVEAVLRAVRAENVRLLVLGRGSNVLFSDAGFSGAVLHLGPGFGKMELAGDDAVRCESGASLMQLCLFAWEHGLSGLEFAYGIPGSVGGAIYMNAGAYGGEIAQTLTRAYHITPDLRRGAYAAGELHMGYRRSAYTDSGYVITGGLFQLRPDDKAAIRSRMDDYMGRRREKQPLDYPSAGSTFKRPEGAYASALIDRCGLKGLQVGGARVSEKHAGFVVNAGGATAADVLALISRVQADVKEKTGFALECEVKLIAE